MQNYLYEFLGTALPVPLGDAVIANVIPNKTKGQNSGWVVITLGWACAALIPVLILTASGAVFNPALVLGLAAIGKLDWAVVPGYTLAEMLGGFVGAVLVWAMYKNHFGDTEDGDTKLGVFCTGPAIRSYGNNFISEMIVTFVLVFAILGAVQAPVGDVAAMGTLGVDAIIFACGASLGGTTGYAMNPTRDLGPRIAHAVPPTPNKRDSDWSYAWIPVIGPICGGLLGAWLAAAIF